MTVLWRHAALPLEEGTRSYNVSRHRKQKMAALVAPEAEILRIVKEPVSGNIVPLRLAS